jgi:hypothetical protein
MGALTVMARPTIKVAVWKNLANYPRRKRFRFGLAAAIFTCAVLAPALGAEKHEHWGEGGSPNATLAAGAAPGKYDDQGTAPQEPGASAPELSAATGTVTQSNCVRNLQIELKTAAGVLHLHDQPGVHVKFMMTSPPAGFDPCKSLKDKRVTVQYKPDDKKGKSNTIYSLRIYAPGETEAPAAPQLPAAAKLAPAPRENEHPTVTTTDEGTVKLASCAGNELDLVFLDHDVEFNLRARDYTRVSIEEDVPFQAGKFDPCTQLSGHDAKITFVILEGKAYDGEIQAIEVLK